MGCVAEDAEATQALHQRGQPPAIGVHPYGEAVGAGASRTLEATTTPPPTTSDQLSPTPATSTGAAIEPAICVPAVTESCSP